jgi:hypothetical protein
MYYALFSNGTSVEKGTFTEAKSIPYSEYIIEKVDVTPQNSRYLIYKHVVLDINGNPKILKIGNFELIDISSDIIERNMRHVELTFFDTKNSIPFKEKITSNFIDVFYTDVISFMEHLNSLGTYEAYQNSLKTEELKKEIANLKDSLNRRDEKIRSLEDELKKLKEG